MRTSTAVLYFALAGTACATSQSIDPTATQSATSPFLDDGGEFDTGVGPGGFGGDPGAGGFSAGGIPSNGGVVVTGGAPPAKGGAGPTTGGAPPMGGAGPTTGGAPHVTGGAPNGGSSGSPQGGSAGSCASNEKVCGGICVRSGPSNGCTPTSCNPCPTAAPANGVQICNQGQCDFDCLSGYTKSGNSCTGGGGGGGGGACNASSCPTCLAGLGQACCTSSNACGCSLFGLPCA